MPDQVNGLPSHVLLVHAVVVLVPLCAVLLAAAAVLPRARARLGVFLPLLALGCVALVPLTVSAGHWLHEQLGEGDPLIERHEHLGEQLLPWTVGLLVLSLVVWWRGRRTPDVASPSEREPVGAGSRGEAASGVLVQALVAVLSLAVAAGAVVQVARIGESGSKAVWQGVVDPG